jgi:hypothetical protein
MTWFVLYAVSDDALVQVFVVVVIHNTAFPIPENPEKQAWPMVCYLPIFPYIRPQIE